MVGTHSLPGKSSAPHTQTYAKLMPPHRHPTSVCQASVNGVSKSARHLKASSFSLLVSFSTSRACRRSCASQALVLPMRVLFILADCSRRIRLFGLDGQWQAFLYAYHGILPWYARSLRRPRELDVATSLFGVKCVFVDERQKSVSSSDSRLSTDRIRRGRLNPKYGVADFERERTRHQLNDPANRQY